MKPQMILAAVGHLPHDHAVLARALEVSGRSGAGLQIAHVLDLPGGRDDLTDASTFLGQAALAARDRLGLTLGEMGADLSQITIHIIHGTHAICLIDLCRDFRPDLVVMRAHQRTRIAEKLLGSTTERVIAAGQTPVLVVKRDTQTPYRHPVLATNGTDNAADTLRFVSTLLPDTKVHVVQAVDIPQQLKEAMLRVGTRERELAKHRKELTKAAGEHLQTLVQNSAASATSQVLKGDPLSVLTRLSQRADVDLIAVGAGRASLIQRAFIGSVSRRLLRDAACDVLICAAH
ncbi:universal stress protein [Sulfitobacter sp. F26169L]|uniref:universal stress protein n=1 Tax=Sulfitobacter sp. F26169L TaxID=2996015 RepID=UPI002260C839|nr:universal stress protein [Sulfitobacter sp. F26169L]MCX7567384.1 universal stress protein [Sulfitobacter sp. F26169L]